MMNQSARYFIPDPSRWPIFGSLALLCMAFGAALWMNEATWGKFLLIFGVCTLFYMMFGWFGTVAHESEGGSYNKQVDTSFRWGMSWFIFPRSCSSRLSSVRCSTCACCRCHGWATWSTS
jgi:Cytochrome c oxidase subunit III.